MRVRFSVSAATNLIKQMSLNSGTGPAALTTFSDVHRRLCESHARTHARHAITQDTHEHAHTPLPFLLRSNLLVSIPLPILSFLPKALRSSISLCAPLMSALCLPCSAPLSSLGWLVRLGSSPYSCVFNKKMKTHKKPKKKKITHSDTYQILHTTQRAAVVFLGAE